MQNKVKCTYTASVPNQYECYQEIRHVDFEFDIVSMNIFRKSFLQILI
jgi:hypothetical protein